jgi:hypothetical protein
LLGVTQARDRAWLSRLIAVPDKVLLEKDPIATALYAKFKQVQMPNLCLDAVEVEALHHFLETQTATHGNAGEEMKMDRARMKMDHVGMKMDHAVTKRDEQSAAQ